MTRIFKIHEYLITGFKELDINHLFSSLTSAKEMKN